LYGPAGAVVIDRGTSRSTLGLKIPCGPTNGTRFPSRMNPRARMSRGRTSPYRAI
jgi:hypothetical protein